MHTDENNTEKRNSPIKYARQMEETPQYISYYMYHNIQGIFSRTQSTESTETFFNPDAILVTNMEIKTGN